MGAESAHAERSWVRKASVSGTHRARKAPVSGTRVAARRAYIYIYIHTRFLSYIYIYTVELPRFSGGGDLYDWHWLFEEAQPDAAWVVTQQIWYFLFPELCLERDGEGVVRLRQDRRWARPLRSPDIDESDSESPQ